MIVLTPRLDAPCPRVAITVTGLDDPSVISIYRESVGEPSRKLPGASSLLVNGDVLVWDFTAPIGQTVTYRLVVEQGTTPEVTTAVTMLWTGVGVLQNPLIPEQSVTVGWKRGEGLATLSGTAFAEQERNVSDVALVPVMGSREPVAFGGQRLVPASVDVSLLTYSYEATQAVTEVIENAWPLLLRTVPTWGLPPLVWLASESIVPRRLPSLPPYGARFEIVGDMVAPSRHRVVVPLFTWDEVEAAYSPATFDEVESTLAPATYLDVEKSPYA